MPFPCGRWASAAKAVALGRRAGVAQALALALASMTAASAVAADAPASPPMQPGRYDATLCVRRADEAPSCGAAELELRGGGVVRVHVSDIVYQVRVGTAPREVVVRQGTMQIDEFVSNAAWSGALLRFEDAEKRLRYEVQVAAMRHTSR